MKPTIFVTLTSVLLLGLLQTAHAAKKLNIDESFFLIPSEGKADVFGVAVPHYVIISRFVNVSGKAYLCTAYANISNGGTWIRAS